MRKSLLLALLLGAATPALAAGAPGDQPNDRQSERSERQQARQEMRAERQQAHQGQSGAEHSAQTGGQDHPRFTPRSASGFNAEQQQNVGRHHGERTLVVEHSEPVVVEQHEPRRVQVDTTVPKPEPAHTERRQSLRERVVRENNTQDVAQSPLRQHDKPVPTVFRNRTPVVSETPREGTQPPLRVESRTREHTNWSTTAWRNNHRYDWHNYRRHHHSLFHLGLYYDPFGWGYRPYSIGWRLWPSYYSSRYWINDPWMYRLPYAPPGYVWVRYWDDALLVDTWTGEVVDVIHNFFW